MELGFPFEKSVAWTVSEITARIKQLLEGNFAAVTVTGEVSNCRSSASGHLYFSLKDKNALISAVLFAGQLTRAPFRPKDGQKIIVTGNLVLYEPRGSYQIRCQTVQLAGEGDLLARLEARKRRLDAEGLFSADRKKPIPKFPGQVAVITSPTGAALQDILNVLTRRRSGSFRLRIFPAVVQGDEAPAVLVHRLQQVNRWKCADVIILGRGGGSIEDLLPFSDEAVVRAVAASSIPVISAVGHEIDWALCDYAADLRAPTPSAAAELVTAESENLFTQLYRNRKRMNEAISRRLATATSRLKSLSPAALQRPLRSRLTSDLFRLDTLRTRLSHSAAKALSRARTRFLVLRQQLLQYDPQTLQKKGFARIRTANALVTDPTVLTAPQTLSLEWPSASAEAVLQTAPVPTRS